MNHLDDRHFILTYIPPSSPNPALCKEIGFANACSSLNLLESTYLDSPINVNVEENNNENNEPFNTLRNIRLSSINQLIIGQLNINSLRNKFEALEYIVSGNLDILVVTESKSDSTFPANQFCMVTIHLVVPTVSQAGVVLLFMLGMPFPVYR